MHVAPAGHALAADLDAVASAGLWRELRQLETVEGARVRVDGREVVSFASCDYLGLATHPRLALAASAAASERGTSAGSARLLAGHTPAVTGLERDLARTFGTPAALVFGSGYLANVGVITALAGPDDLIVSDALSHASTVDACRLSRATVRVLRHNDVEHLDELLADGQRFRRRLVLVEGVYSMDGDSAPLVAIAERAARHDALVVVDDAHGLGVVGPGGRGSAAAAGVSVAVQIGNLGKALGSYGAFVLCDDTVREWLVQTSRAFVFTCALPPTVVDAARVGVALLAAEPRRVQRCQANAARLRAELQLRDVRTPPGDTPIVPVPVGGRERALRLARRLFERGWLAPAVRPPTVPEGTSRLRLSVSAAHTAEQCAALAADIAELAHG